MQQMTSTQAKQNFGELLAAAALAPVAIERHGKVQTVMAAPRFFMAEDPESDVLAQRRLARLNQSLVEKDRLIRHQRIALELVLASEPQRHRLVAGAQAVVERWQRERLCSQDYIERWRTILQLPVTEMVREMTADGNAWGPALRQNSPWVVSA